MLPTTGVSCSASEQTKRFTIALKRNYPEDLSCCLSRARHSNKTSFIDTLFKKYMLFFGIQHI